MTVTPYTGRHNQTIDWREINRISRQTGRAQGSGDFFTMLTEYQQQQRKLQEQALAAQEALYEEAAGDEKTSSSSSSSSSSKSTQIDTSPESSSTRDKSAAFIAEQTKGMSPEAAKEYAERMGYDMSGKSKEPDELNPDEAGTPRGDDKILTALGWGLDKISRPLQFIGGFAAEQQGRGNQEYDGTGDAFIDQFNSAFFGIVPNSLKDLQRGFEAGSESFMSGAGSGKNKFGHSWIEEVEKDREGHGMEKHPEWLKNVAALGFDLTLDPLNYVGVGLVAKAATKTKIAGDATSAATAAAPDTEKLINKIVDLNLSIPHHTPETEEITHVVLDKPTLEEIFGFASGPNPKKRLLSGSERVTKMKEAMQKVEDIKAAVNDADFDELVSPVVKSLNEQIDVAKAAVPTAEKIATYGKSVYSQALRRMKEKGEYPDLPTGIKKSKVIEDVEETVGMPRLKEAVMRRRELKRAQGKVKAGNAAQKQYVKRHGDKLSEAKGHWFESHGFTDKDIDDAVEAAQKNPSTGKAAYHNEKRASVLKQKARDAEKDLKRRLNPETGKTWTEAERTTVKAKAANMRKEADAIHYHITMNASERLSEVISAKRQDAILESHPRLKTINSEIDRIQDRINVLEETEGVSSGQNITTMAEPDVGVNSLGDAIPGQGASSPLEELRSQQRALQKEAKDITHEVKTTKERFRTAKGVVKREDVSEEEWTKLHDDRIEEQTKVEYDRLATIKKREKRMGGGERAVHKATGGKDDGIARVSVGDEKLTYAQFVKKTKTDKSLVTEADAKVARHKTSHLEKKGNVVTDEAVAFERLLKEQTGMDLKEFAAAKAKIKDEQALRRITHDGKEYTQDEYIKMRRSKGTAVRESTDEIPWNKSTVTRKQFADTNMGSNAEFDALLKKFADEKPDAYNKMMRDQWHAKFKKTTGRRAPSTKHVTSKQAFLTKEEEASTMAQAREIATQKIAKEEDTGEFKFSKFQEQELTFKTPVERLVEDDRALLIRQKRADAEAKAEAIKQEKVNAKLENRDVNTEAVNDLFRKREEARRQARTESAKMKKQLIKDLEVTSLVNIVNNTIDETRTVLRVNVAGIPIDVPTPESVYKMGDALGRVAIIKKTRTAWARAFIASKGLESELQLRRIRAVNDAPFLIRTRVEQLKHDFAHYPMAERKDSLNYIRLGGEARNDLDRATIDTLNQMVKYFTNKVRLSDDSYMTLTPADINAYIGNDKFKVLASRNRDKYLEIGEGKDILKYVDLGSDVDPLKFMWEMAAAQEQALAHAAMRDVIRNSFGLRYSAAVGDQVAMLRKNHGWTSVKGMGDDYLFDPEVGDQIRRIMEMLKPQNTHEIVKMYDKAMHAWKGAVTVYNVPGYYARNGIGELIMGLFDGVNNVRHYRAAARMLKYDAPDEIKESLKALRPWDTFQSKAQIGGQKIIRRKYGPDLDIAEALVLYRETGLHTGFISSEYDANVPLEAFGLRSSPVGKAATKVNESVRARAEKFEDYWRMAHFVSRMERSTIRDTVKAAEEAAHYVRKYHFDYTDFTPFEKSVMTRLFPFYKWTRKAMPMMGSLLFSKPGAMMVYPKVANYLQNPLNGEPDGNGFAPNWEDTVIPEWMQGMNAYNWSGIMGGGQTAMNLSTPQFDSFKGYSDPKTLAFNMLSPSIKAPLELGGANPGEDFEGNPTKNTLADDFPINSKWEYLARLLPQGSFGLALKDRMSDEHEDGPDVKTRIASFLSGVGLYDMAASGATNPDGSSVGSSDSGSSGKSGGPISHRQQMDKKTKKLLDLLDKLGENEKENNPYTVPYDPTTPLPTEFR